MKEKENDDFKKFKELMDKKFVNYFNKNFVNENIYNSMSEGFKDASLRLAGAYVSFAFLVKSIDAIKKDKKFYDKLSGSQKEILEQYKMCNEYIADKINEIIDFIQGIIAESYK